ncbi:hypothetical protein BN2476_470101 [Paraburkholderia piptadeniae]|uniref:Transposase n=1 Tax=Paraburkholderia piptadeniae TaxID=1701573 RepID=A0A1N7SE78_9BURK|nr:hypothetical protein BN2476_470101 [Paraburkholderia piptadeniae]
MKRVGSGPAGRAAFVTDSSALLKPRSVGEILIAVIDRSASPFEALVAAFPTSALQTCIVHLFACHLAAHLIVYIGN